MFPNTQTTARGHDPPKGAPNAVSPVPLAQEVTEGPIWSPLAGFNYVADHFREPLPQEHPSRSRGGPVVRVKLSKSPSPTKEPMKFFVRPAGGMSVSVPELDHQPAPRVSRSHSQKGECPAREPVGSMSSSTGNYLPLSVELIAGRGQTSMPPDGNKSGASSGGKVKSLPPSHTLAMSASLLKSYFTSSSSAPENKQQAKSAGSTPEAETSVKTKMLGLWNNVKYGWTVNLKTNFSRDYPVYLLGGVYHKSLGEDEENSDEVEVGRHGMEAFKQHFYTLVWCTYRRQFPILQDSTLTTDCGWGCMLRSGQMMLAQALTRHFLTPDWRHTKHLPHTPEELVHLSIIRWFGDSPSPHCPLSLHNLVHFGHKLGKKAGDWYGPASVAYIFKEAVEMGSRYIPDLQRVCVYVAQDCAVYIQDVLDLCSTPCVCQVGTLYKMVRGRGRTRGTQHLREAPYPAVQDPPYLERAAGVPNNTTGVEGRLMLRTLNAANGNEENGHCGESDTQRLRGGSAERPVSTQCSKCDNWRSVLIMVPVRLGGESLNPIYAPCIYSLFTHDLSIGIIGGRPKHSLYFVGFQEESLIHLDPHLCQDSVMVTQAVFSPSSYHCSSPRKMSLSRMDPSATLGFYCHSRTDFLRLMEELPELLTPKEPGFEYPIFEFLDGTCPDVDACTRQVSTEDEMAASLPNDTPLLPQDSEEFVFL